MRGYDDAPVKRVIEALVKEDLQSDNRFTEMYIHTRINKGYGPVRIKQELQQRGIDNTLIAHHLERPEEDWLEISRRVREKKFGKALPGDIKSKMKQSRFLQQRGFNGDLIRKTLGSVEE
ncbi:MAG TPA: regulatory protein RecX [Gammaproteobacteria bacterium]|nr:regulatory protein RecX [Gammaproteobacteria bacterium]